MLPESDEIQSSASKRELLCQQWQLCLLAISFFTRIPVNMAVDVTAKMLNEASRFFALVGVLIGIISALAFYLSAMSLPTEIALLIAMKMDGPMFGMALAAAGVSKINLIL